MTDETLTKRERSIRKSEGMGLGRVLLVAAVVVLILAVTGCAGTLDRSVATCAGLDGSWEYTRAESVEKFSCQRQAAHTRTVGR